MKINNKNFQLAKIVKSHENNFSQIKSHIYNFDRIYFQTFKHRKDGSLFSLSVFC